MTFIGTVISAIMPMDGKTGHNCGKSAEGIKNEADPKSGFLSELICRNFILVVSFQLIFLNYKNTFICSILHSKEWWEKVPAWKYDSADAAPHKHDCHPHLVETFREDDDVAD